MHSHLIKFKGKNGIPCDVKVSDAKNSDDAIDKFIDDPITKCLLPDELVNNREELESKVTIEVIPA